MGQASRRARISQVNDRGAQVPTCAPRFYAWNMPPAFAGNIRPIEMILEVNYERPQ